MAQPVIQHSFQAGEWAPALNARVDLKQYHSGAALLRNFFVDYRGGASTCPGTKYVGTAGDSNNPVRLIRFQISATVGYVLEFGHQYIRFIFNGAYVLVGGLPYTLATTYLGSELALIKFAQNVNTLILCHPNHMPKVLTLVSATNWTLADITFGANLSAPTIAAATITGGTGTTNYLYCATSVDANGQESLQSAVFGLNGADISSTTKGSIRLTLGASISGAQFYKFYKTALNYAGAVPSGPAFGYIGYTYSLDFIDDNIAPDFSQTPPISGSVFQNGGNVISTTITNSGVGTFATIPDVIFAAAPAGGTTASAYASMSPNSLGTFANRGAGFTNGQVVNDNTNVMQIRIDATLGGGQVANFTVLSVGFRIGVGSALESTLNFAGGTLGLIINVNWLLASITLTFSGSLYPVAPAITFSTGGAAATCAVNPINSTGGAGVNPLQTASIPAFFQERLVLASPPGAPQTFYMSQPGLPYDFNVSNPVQADDAISGSLVNSQLNTITAIVPMSQGLVMFGLGGAWLINGGTPGSVATPINVTATAQSYEGSSDIPPIVVNYDVLYVQSKGSIVRDLTWNFYLSNHVGTDITLLSSHLFYGYTLKEWAYAEEPFKLVWAVRSDGTLLCLCYVKEQEIIGWSHRDTNGHFKSICSISEQVTLSNGNQVIVDAVYVVVQRFINGSFVQYIERFAERIFPNGVQDAWFVDAGIQYSGSPTSSFSGAQHLAGQTVVGLADGVAITPFTMPNSGNFTLPAPASKVTVGLQYTPQLQTLRLDAGERTIQGKRKKIPAVTLRVEDTLGLSIGGSFANLVVMKDLILGNVGSMSNEVVTGLVTEDARALMDPSWTVQGQYCIEQDTPYPATILGVIPEIEVGDT